MALEYVLRLLRNPKQKVSTQTVDGFSHLHLLTLPICSDPDRTLHVTLQIHEDVVPPSPRFPLHQFIGDLCVDYLGDVETFRLLPTIASVFAIPPEVQRTLRRFGPDMKFADIIWAQQTVADMITKGILEPRLRLLLYAAYYKNKEIIELFQDREVHVLDTFCKGNLDVQQKLAHKYVLLGQLLAQNYKHPLEVLGPFLDHTLTGSTLVTRLDESDLCDILRITAFYAPLILIRLLVMFFSQGPENVWNSVQNLLERMITFIEGAVEHASASGFHDPFGILFERKVPVRVWRFFGATVRFFLSLEHHDLLNVELILWEVRRISERYAIPPFDPAKIDVILDELIQSDKEKHESFMEKVSKKWTRWRRTAS